MPFGSFFYLFLDYCIGVQDRDRFGVVYRKREGKFERAQGKGLDDALDWDLLRINEGLLEVCICNMAVPIIFFLLKIHHKSTIDWQDNKLLGDYLYNLGWLTIV